MRVHLLQPPEPESYRILEQILTTSSPADNPVQLSFGERLPVPCDFEVLVAGRPGRAQLATSPNLHSLVIPWAGLPSETYRLLEDFPHLKVYNLHHNAAATAEMAVALLLAAARQIIPADQALRRNDWRPRYQAARGMGLAGETVVVLGFGEIGQRVGRACHGLGMQVIGVRKHPARPLLFDYPVQVHPPEALPGLLSIAQALVICLPGSLETQDWIDGQVLRAMPPGGVLINVGRGSVVDQKALFECLKDGHLRGAGLDVWYHYPANPEEVGNTEPADYPFGELENMVLSPHCAGLVEQTETLRMQHLAELLVSLAKGEEPASKIEWERGY